MVGSTLTLLVTVLANFSIFAVLSSPHKKLVYICSTLIPSCAGVSSSFEPVCFDLGLGLEVDIDSLCGELLELF